MNSVWTVNLCEVTVHVQIKKKKGREKRWIQLKANSHINVMSWLIFPSIYNLELYF